MRGERDKRRDEGLERGGEREREAIEKEKGGGFVGKRVYLGKKEKNEKKRRRGAKNCATKERERDRQRGKIRILN